MKYINIRTVTLIVIPVVIISLQVIIKVLTNGLWSDHLGITLSAIGIGQIFPLIIEENLLASKFLRIDRVITESNKSDSLMTIEYKVEKIGDLSKFDELRLMCILLFIVCLLIFIVTVFFNVGEYPQYLSIATGSFNCVLAWLYYLKQS